MRAQLVLENVAVRFPNRVLFENVNFSLYEGSRVTFAGRNGSGKSTLMRILAGEMEPHTGTRTVVGKKDLRIGYLDQSLLDSAVLQTLSSDNKDLSPLTYSRQQLLSKRQDVFETELDWEIGRILGGLGFSKELLEAPIHHLSGGWLLRMFIGIALLNKPEVLLLDEPTNHLDMASIQWLEEFLENEYEGSLVLVTHDVTLQRNTTDALAVIHGGHFYFRDHQKDYISFMESLKDEERILTKNLETLDKKIAEIDAFVLRFRAKARMASRASSKQKNKEDLLEEKAELEDRLARVRGFQFDLHFRFRMESSGSKFPISVKGGRFKYQKEQPWILQNVEFDIKRGQKVAIIGENGAGKTTLLNLLAGRLDFQEGKLECGYGVEIGYFGQHQLDELSLEETVLDNLRMKSQGVGLEQLRGWLGAFGFQGNDEVSKKAKVLSGGERARLALLRILLSPCNVCLLDEPTNHLDIETKELLRRAMKTFEGTVLFVSHDRDFIRGLAERILFVTVDHKIIDHVGDLDSFMTKYPQTVRHLENRQTTEKKKPVKEVAPENTLSYEERKQVKNRSRSLERKISQLEEQIAELGKTKEKLSTEAAHPALFEEANAETRKRILTNLEAVETQLSSAMSEWERLGTELEILRQKYGVL